MRITVVYTVGFNNFLSVITIIIIFSSAFCQKCHCIVKVETYAYVYSSMFLQATELKGSIAAAFDVMHNKGGILKKTHKMPQSI